MYPRLLKLKWRNLIWSLLRPRRLRVCVSMPPIRAGGVSRVASLIVERALSGDFFTARKLGFAQQIVSG